MTATAMAYDTATAHGMLEYVCMLRVSYSVSDVPWHVVLSTACCCCCNDGWMDGWTDGWVGGRVGGWVGGECHSLIFAVLVVVVLVVVQAWPSSQSRCCCCAVQLVCTSMFMSVTWCVRDIHRRQRQQ